MNVVVVVPTRGRPDAARLTIQAIRETAIRVSTKIVLVCDADDPELYRYRKMLERLSGKIYRDFPTLVVLQPDETGNLVTATNTVATRIAREDPHCIIGNLNDDHRPRTRGWDKTILDTLTQPGIAYGNDLIHGERLPSAPFISAEVVNALGWYFLPTLEHLYGDDAVRDLGDGLGRLHYLGDVIIEHMHPAVKKGQWDEGYERANNPDAAHRDHVAYLEWKQTFFLQDVDTVRRALEAAA